MSTTQITLMFHLEHVDDGHCWWAETEDVAGFSALGATLEGLRDRVTEALDDIVGVGNYTMRERLVGHRESIDGGAAITTDPRLPAFA
jgi:predicted RNase H-like HicB family nuclease